MIAAVASAQSITPTLAIFGCNPFIDKVAAVFAAVIKAIGAALMRFIGLFMVTPRHPVAPTIGEKVLPFFDGSADSRGRTYAGILLWNDRQLEVEHDWVQQVFPNPRKSSFHPEPDKWVLTDEIKAAIQADPARQGKLRQAYLRVLRFFHLDIPIAALPIWVTPGNHNFLRVTRIITALKCAGLEPEAQDFMQRLRALANLPGARQAIGASFEHWERAIA